MFASALGIISSVTKDLFGYFDNFIQNKISALKFISNLNSIVLNIQMWRLKLLIIVESNIFMKINISSKLKSFDIFDKVKIWKSLVGHPIVLN